MFNILVNVNFIDIVMIFLFISEIYKYIINFLIIKHK
jgi:hypothetical protein